MKKQLTFIVLLALGPHLARAQFKVATLPLLDQAAMASLVPIVKSIRAEPNTISIRVGQTVQLSRINVIVTDASGKDRGRLSGFDFSNLKGEPAEVVPRQITGKRPGNAVLTIHYPRTVWKGRSDARPAATVKVEVKP